MRSHRTTASLPPRVRSRRGKSAGFTGSGISPTHHREGTAIKDFFDELPPLLVVGADTDPTGAGVDTLALPPARYDPEQIQTFGCLRALLRRALRERDTELLGRVATCSADINQTFLPTNRFEEIKRIADAPGAVVVQVSHSGTVAGLLFAPDGPAVGTRADDAAAQLRHLGFAPYQLRTDEGAPTTRRTLS